MSTGKSFFLRHLSRQIPDMQVTITDDGIILVSGTERRLNDEIKSFFNLYFVEITKCIPNIRFQFVITVYKVFAHSKSLFYDR
jgi:hypothetical protein